MTSASDPRPEAMAASGQLAAQALVVVDLAVAHHVHVAVLVGERLGAARHVDDRQATAAEAGAASDDSPIGVRAAMPQAFRHAPQHRVGGRCDRADHAVDPAHRRYPAGRRSMLRWSAYSGTSA